jgi:hypothetical protein
MAVQHRHLASTHSARPDEYLSCGRHSFPVSETLVKQLFKKLKKKITKVLKVRTYIAKFRFRVSHLHYFFHFSRFPIMDS